MARSLNRFQQLNAVKLSGVTTRTLDDAPQAAGGDRCRRSRPGYSFDYTGESRQLRTEGNKFVPAFALAVLMIFPVLAVQFTFRDGSSPPIGTTGDVRGAIFTVVEDAGSEHAFTGPTDGPRP